MFKIETWKNNPILRKIAQKITNKNFKQAVTLWKKMIKYIKNRNNGWVWLAAPQIWYSISLMVVSMINSYEDKSFKTIILINPEILEYSEKKDLQEEWCLSVPWIKAKVERPIKIKLQYFDEKNNKKIFILEWLKARIIQHEIDHLIWKLFIDYLK